MDAGADLLPPDEPRPDGLDERAGAGPERWVRPGEPEPPEPLEEPPSEGG